MDEITKRFPEADPADLELLAAELATYRKATADLNRDGLVVETDRGLRPHPAYGVRCRAFSNYCRMLARLNKTNESQDDIPDLDQYT